MKKTLLTIAIVLLAIAAQAQIKMHSNGRITFQTLNNTTNQGIVFGTAPDWKVDFNGQVNFHNTGLFVKNAANYEWMSHAKADNNYAVAWAVTLQSWNNPNFFVYANGETHAKILYTTGVVITSKNTETIDGEEALSIISGINGYYYGPEEQEIPNLEGNEFVDPEAVDAIYADFGKRSAVLSGSNLEEVFPEAVRTDMNNRLCIDYQSVVTMLVEAVKHQQREIEELRGALEKAGLNK